MTSFISHELTFTLGFGMLTGGAVRLRLYQSKGVEPGRILAVGVLCSIIFWMGLAAIAGLCLIAAPSAFASIDGVAAWGNLVIGLGSIGALIG